MAEKEKKVVAPKKVKKKESPKKEDSAFENRSDIKKLVLYTIIVPRGQGENIIRLLKANKSSAQFVQFGEGTASNANQYLFIYDGENPILTSLKVEIIQATLGLTTIKITGELN